MNVSRLTVMICFLLVAACSKYSNDPHLSRARDFIDAYYVMADQTLALNITSGMAHDKIQSEVELLKNVTMKQDAYRSRDVLFELKRSQDQGNSIAYFYELTIKVPGMDDQKRLVNIMIDKKTMKVSYFAEVQE